MNASELTGHGIKTVEYLIAVIYLLLFVPFWRFVSGGARVAVQPARAGARQPAEWFSVPDGLGFHPGHAWVRRDAGDVVTVGWDDFARKLIGPLGAVSVPRVGQAVRQGEPALQLVVGDKHVAMLAPVDGEVVEVNAEALTSPQFVNDDPYGRGWLFKVRPRRWAANAKQLLSGDLARRWMEGVTDRLRAEMSPALGVLLQDGGQPVHGIAKELYEERWDEGARSFLLS